MAGRCFRSSSRLIFGPATRVMSLRDGTKKMSKSDVSDYSRINLADDADTIALKIRKAKTDPEVLPGTADGLAGRPEAANLLGIYAALADSDIETACARFAGQSFAAFKGELADLAAQTLGRIGAEMQRLEADPGYIEALLQKRRRTRRGHRAADPERGVRRGGLPARRPAAGLIPICQPPMFALQMRDPRSVGDF